MTDRRNVEKRLGKFTVPRAGELVRGRALAAGKEAFGRQAVPDVWERTWSSPILRLAWAAAVLVLGVCHLVLPAGPSGAADPPRYVERVLGAGADEELVADLTLPPLDRAVQRRWIDATDDSQGTGEM